MTKAPLVSVIMPAYNAAEYIKEAVVSILDQSLGDLELIIVDDGSTDDTWEIMEKLAGSDNRITILRNDKNRNICYTLNKAIDAARGKYIARMDSDDWSYSDRLQKQFTYLESHEGAVIVGGSIEVCDREMNVLNTRSYELEDVKIRGKLLRYSQFAHPCVMYSSEAVREAGKYDETLFDAEDYDLYFRLGNIGAFGNLPDTVLKLRTHPQSISYKKITRQAWLTLKIKLKAIFVYGYKAGLGDVLHLLLHLFGNLLVPAGLKFKAFNLYRRFVPR